MIHRLSLFFLCSIIFFSCKKDKENLVTTIPDYQIIDTFNHNTLDFTQGLVFHNGFLYEGTGIYGNSRLMQKDISTGNVLQQVNLSIDYFGEGITIYNNKIYQLTWLSNKGFVYDLNTFALVDSFSYSTEGWGITNRNNEFVMSDGSSNLYFFSPPQNGNPITISKTITVQQENGMTFDKLNELEWIDDKIWANVLDEDYILIINPETGIIEQQLDVTSITKNHQNGPLNGIAFNTNTNTVYITGKRWTKLYEIRVN